MFVIFLITHLTEMLTLRGLLFTVSLAHRSIATDVVQVIANLSRIQGFQGLNMLIFYV